MSKTASWYSIRKHAPIAAAVLAAALAQGAEPPKASAEILIYGDIGESWWSESVSAAQFVRELQALDVDAITVRVNSVGGSVPDGIAIHNAMRRHPATITTVVDGMALSIASLIVLGGDVVQMAENATYMVHAPWTYAVGNAVDLREMADQLDTWAGAMSTTYAAKTGKPQAEMLALLGDGKDHWYTAAEAKDAGFVDEVISAAPIAAMAGADLSRFKDVPEHVKAQLQARLSHRSQSAAAAASTTEILPMPGATTPPAATPDQAALDAARAEGARLENQRRADIDAEFNPFLARAGFAELRDELQKDPKATAEAARKKILAKMAEGATPLAGGYVAKVEDEADKFRAAAATAIMARASVETKDGIVRASTDNPFRGYKLLDLARASLDRIGVNTRGMDQMRIVAAAFTQSGSDFPVLLENVMHKTLQEAYAIQADSWSRFCKRGSVSDFRAHNRYRVGSLGNLELVNELGEFKNKTIPDGEKASISAGTKGNIINLSRQAIINDDLDAFVGLSNALGRAAKRTIEADVFALLVSNSGAGPTLADGKALFHADHGNITATNAAPTVASFDDARQGMAKQKDVGGNDYLDLRPAVWLGPLSIGGAARVTNGAQYDPDTANKLQRPNIVNGLFADIVDSPRLTGTRWYAFADPQVAPALEVAFLDGVSDPYLELQNGFTVDGAQWKVRLDYGVAGIDYRGAWTNPGA